MLGMKSMNKKKMEKEHYLKIKKDMNIIYIYIYIYMYWKTVIK